MKRSDIPSVCKALCGFNLSKAIDVYFTKNPFTGTPRLKTSEAWTPAIAPAFVIVNTQDSSKNNLKAKLYVPFGMVVPDEFGLGQGIPFGTSLENASHAKCSNESDGVIEAWKRIDSICLCDFPPQLVCNFQRFLGRVVPHRDNCEKVSSIIHTLAARYGVILNCMPSTQRPVKSPEGS